MDRASFKLLADASSEEDDVNGFYLLSSDACLNAYPSNRREHFINTFPFPLVNRQNKKYYIKVISICISSTTGSLNNDIPSYIRINIQQLQPQRHGLGFTKTAAGFPYPPTEFNDDGCAIHSFNNALYLPLLFQELYELRITLVDEKDELISGLNDGPPTLILVQLTDRIMEDRFTISCCSHQPELFPENTLAEFRVPLPTELALPGYEVALLNLLFPSHLKDEEESASVTINDVKLVFNLDRITTTAQFITSVRRLMRDNHMTPHLTFGKLMAGPHRGQLHFHMLPTSPMATITITPSPSFTLACGQRTPKGTVILQPDHFMVFDGQPSVYLSRPNPVAMLTCDIVKSNVIGGKQSNLLQFTPIFKKKPAEANKLYEPKQLIYHKVVNRPFDHIKFVFLEGDGRSKTLLSSTPRAAIYATLAFRRRKERSQNEDDRNARE